MSSESSAAQEDGTSGGIIAVVILLLTKQNGTRVYDRNLLTDFVRESNAIEGISAEPGYPLYDNHLLAAVRVYESAVTYAPALRMIHNTVMRGQSYATPGVFREGWVQVGGRTCPDPLDIDGLWQQLNFKTSERRDQFLLKQREAPSEDELMDWHHELMFIHPFIDGNGRTGRLWLNSQRLFFGYPWLTIRNDEKQEYYASIRMWIAGRNLK